MSKRNQFNLNTFSNTLFWIAIIASMIAILLLFYAAVSLLGDIESLSPESLGFAPKAAILITLSALSILVVLGASLFNLVAIHKVIVRPLNQIQENVNSNFSAPPLALVAYRCKEIDEISQFASLAMQKQRELERDNLNLNIKTKMDSMTGCYNRKYFEETLSVEFNRAKRHQRNLSLLVIDIDHFKIINDTYGHPFGDICIKEIAKILMRNAIRSGDVVCRIGGEEFVVIAPDTNKESAMVIAERIRQSVLTTAIQDTQKEISISMSVSIGIADTQSISIDNDECERLYSMADQALYISKSTGRNKSTAQ